ncbi:TPA: hypothetical protein LT061_004570 [Salmonella enterica subsp. enterica serovar Blitta]|nr:hypothetical protein [Salmonella enterica subsp. enterica serovar Blitta]
MSNDSILKNSSIFIAYMGCLGWGSAYFYGWGVSHYYGFPWWYVGIGTDNIARSLFYAFSLMFIFFIAWTVGAFLFFIVKQKTHVRDLGILRLFFALVLFFIPVVIEFSILNEKFMWELTLIFITISVLVMFCLRFYGNLISLNCITQLSWVRKHCLVLIMSGFIIYFWGFSFIVGIYKPQLKKEYEMIQFHDEWYYVLARHHDSFILSKSFTKNNNRFVIFRPQSGESYAINLVKVRL